MPRAWRAGTDAICRAGHKVVRWYAGLDSTRLFPTATPESMGQWLLRTGSSMGRDVLVFIVVATACGGGGRVPPIEDAAVSDGPPVDTPADPPRTVTTVLRRQGFGPHCLDFESGAVTTCPCGGCAVDLTLDAAGNFSGAGAEIVSVGS